MTSGERRSPSARGTEPGLRCRPHPGDRGARR